jgi:hypothetical protein
MSRRVHDAAFALTSDGAMLLNVAHFGRRIRPEELLRLALLQPGELFVGVTMTKSEVTRVLQWSADIHNEAVTFVVGKRERRMRRSRVRRAKVRL